jgi:hypothetical protein
VVLSDVVFWRPSVGVGEQGSAESGVEMTNDELVRDRGNSQSQNLGSSIIAACMSDHISAQSGVGIGHAGVDCDGLHSLVAGLLDAAGGWR